MVEHTFEAVRDAAKGEEALRRQLSRSGDTIFEVRDIAIENLGFVPMSVVGELRREALNNLEISRLSDYEFELHLASFIDSTNRWERKAQYPSKVLTPQDNVTNHLAREFYIECGVEEIAEGLDCRPSTAGEQVIISDYCIRREIGECLLEKPRLKGDLFLVRGTKKYRLCFDCKKCQMKIIDEK